MPRRIHGERDEAAPPQPKSLAESCVDPDHDVPHKIVPVARDQNREVILTGVGPLCVRASLVPVQLLDAVAGQGAVNAVPRPHAEGLGSDLNHTVNVCRFVRGYTDHDGGDLREPRVAFMELPVVYRGDRLIAKGAAMIEAPKRD